MILFKKISLSILLFIFLLLGAVVFLVSTTSGLYILFNAASRWMPGLEIGQITGNWHNLRLKNIRYQQSGMLIDAGEFCLTVKLSCLRDSKLYIDNLLLKDVNVTIDSKKISPSILDKKKDCGQLNLFTPYPIVLQRVIFNNINVSIDSMAISVIDFSSGLYWYEKNLSLTPTSLKGLLIAMPKVTDIAQKEIVEFKVQNPQPQRRFLGKILKDFFSKLVVPKITDIHYFLNLNIEEFRGEHLRLVGDTDLTVLNMLIKFSSIDRNMKLDILNIDTNQGSVNATGNALLYDNWPVNITVNSNFNIDPLKGEKIKLKVNGALRDKLEINANCCGPIDMMLSGKTRLAEFGLPLNLEVVSKQFFWPFISNKQFQANNMKLKISGKMSDYILSFRGAIKGQRIPPATITLDATGDEQHINLNKLTIEALEGKTELTASVDWQQAISWYANVKLTGINTTKKIPEWPSKLNGLIKTRGCLYDNNWQVDVPEIKLIGKIKQNKIKIDGSLKGNNDLQWIIPSFHMALSQNTIDIKGELGVKNLDLNVIIDASNLDNTLPGLRGSTKGLIKVRGTIEAPQLLVDITANSLRWRNLSIKCIRIDGHIKSDNQIAGNLNLCIKHIMQSGGISVNLITLSAKGNERKHDLQLRVQGHSVSGQLYLSGNFDRQSVKWKGRLDNTRFNTPIGLLKLSYAIALDYHNAEQKINIGLDCWANPNAKLYIPQTINIGIEGDAVVNFKHFNLAMIKSFMPSTMQASGIVNSKINATWDINKAWLTKASVILSGYNVKITQIINEIPLVMAFDVIYLNADLRKNYAQLSWLIHMINNHGQSEAQVQVIDLLGKRNLRGSINIHNFDLSMLNSIFSFNIKMVGLLNANLRLAGNIKSPQLFGQIQFNNIDINGNFMPFDMQPSQIKLNFNGMRSTITGKVYTSKGEINLSGGADWTRVYNWHARLVVKGSYVRIIVPPIIQLDISPDVVFEATPNLFTLDGSIVVPWARIVVQEVPDSVLNISSDEVLLNENLKPIEKKSIGIQINSNLTVHMGNNVRLDAFGLKTRLTADLKVVQNKRGLELNGQINIPEGRFHAYGQDLIVRKGELLFSGLPDQPVLNIEAIRNPDSTEDNVIVGVRVTGYANEPKGEIFSEPTMSQQEMLSYLLRGQRLNSNQNDNATMISILVGLGITESGQILDKISNKFGIKNLTLDTQGVGNSSQIVISGYVLPGLQIEYGVGIFDSLAKLTIRYRLMPKLYLEAVSGADQTIDLLYQFDF